MLFNDFKSMQACIKYETQGNILFCYYYVCPQKLCHFATGKRFDIFSKLFLQWVGIHEKSSPVHGRWSVGVMRGVAGPRPFFAILQ